MAANNRLTAFIGHPPDTSLSPSPSPRLTTQPPTDRQKMAANLRMPSKNQRSASANMNTAHNPEPAYEQSAGVAQRNTVHGGHQMYTAYPPEQEQENRDGFDDTTVESEDFDDTIGRGSVSSGHNMGGIGVDNEFENGYHKQHLEAVQENFQDAHDNAYIGDLPDESDPGHNYVGDAPAPHQSRKLFNQYDGQGPQTQALGEPFYKQSQTQKAPFQSQVPQLPQQNSPSKQKISGRFNQGKIGLANRPKNERQAAESSRKRALDGGVFSPVPRVGNSQLVEDLENAIPRGLPPPRTQNMQSAQIDGHSIDENFFEESSHIDEQPALQSRPVERERFPAANLQHQKAILNLATIPLDYDDDALKHMDYDQLRDESWEAPSAPSPASEQTSEPDISLSGKPLNERVSHYVEPHASNQEEIDQQRASMAEFFGNLSKDEWEEAGDWFLDRFAGILQALKEARKEKRAAVAGFEKEIEKREKEVKGSLEAYHKDMQRMKRGAKGVIEGTTV